MADGGTLDDLVGRIGGHLALEQALFEATGRVARDTTDAALSVVLGRACEHHARRIEQWMQRLPALPDPAPAVVAVDLGTVSASMILAALSERWLPALARRYEEHLAIVEPAVDAPTWHTLRRALDDLDSERELISGAPR